MLNNNNNKNKSISCYRLPVAQLEKTVNFEFFNSQVRDSILKQGAIKIKGMGYKVKIGISHLLGTTNYKLNRNTYSLISIDPWDQNVRTA